MPDTLERLRKGLNGRYRLERELGRGGMATVYLAHDLHHDRPVALKLLHPDLAATLGAERFQREIKLAARLQHPHILSVFDSGETSGFLWFTMPFVEGESLRERLTRERQLPVDEAVRICREAALALDFAHRHSVVHRDIKPENILLIDGQAMVADFGIARALGGSEALTATGMAVGTPAYMSPEQASGDHALDARTDVYSLGCVLYECLAGEAPFSGPTAAAVIARVMSEQPRRLTTTRPTVPVTLEAAVSRAMARAPADRPASAGEFARLLESAMAPILDRAPILRGWMPNAVVIAAAVLLVGLAALVWLRDRPEESSARRIAVLPFENAGSTDDEYFADGMTDEVRSKLAAIPGLQVTARASTSSYKGSTKSPREIARELDVQYLLTGTVRWSKGIGPNRVRVTPELIQASNASTRWSQPFDTVLSDVFAVQASIASQVAQALNVTLGAPARERIAEPPTASLGAYDEFLKGEQITTSLGVTDIQILKRALPHYERAVALDSNFGQAWSAIARAQSLLNGTAPTVEGVERARVAAERALALAPNRAAGHIAMGVYLRTVKLDYAAAYEHFIAGLKEDPNNAELLTSLAALERSLGRFEDALQHALLARQVDPRSVATARAVARAYHDLRHYPAALAAWDRALSLAPNSLAIIHGKVFDFLATGHLDSVHALVAGKLKTVDTTALLVRFAFYQETMWALPPSLWPKIVQLTVADFSGDRGHWALKLGNTYRLLGDTVRAKVFGDSAVLVFKAALKNFPEDAQYHELYGRALALAGRRAEAIEAAERSLKLRETSLDASIRPYVHFQVARILIQSGEYERALDMIEPLLTTPASDVTPDYLMIDPTFKPLRGNPRFERLLSKLGTVA
ncbi:MAG: protein kinase domain-containing protein [Gemmatimonadaceae bacterium]